MGLIAGQILIVKSHLAGLVLVLESFQSSIEAESPRAITISDASIWTVAKLAAAQVIIPGEKSTTGK